MYQGWGCLPDPMTTTHPTAETAGPTRSLPHPFPTQVQREDSGKTELSLSQVPSLRWAEHTFRSKHTKFLPLQAKKCKIIALSYSMASSFELGEIQVKISWQICRLSRGCAEFTTLQICRKVVRFKINRKVSSLGIVMLVPVLLGNYHCQPTYHFFTAGVLLGSV